MGCRYREPDIHLVWPVATIVTAVVSVHGRHVTVSPYDMKCETLPRAIGEFFVPCVKRIVSEAQYLTGFPWGLESRAVTMSMRTDGNVG